MKTQLRNINKSTVAGIIIVLGFTIPTLIIPSYSSNPIYKNWGWTYNTGEFIYEIEISYDGDYYIVCTSSSLLLFHKSSPIPIWRYKESNHVHSVSISQNGNHFAVIDHDNLYIYSKIGSYIDLCFTKAFDRVRAVEFSRNGEYFVVTDYKTIHLYSASTFSPVWSFTSEKYVGEVEISADGSYIVAVDESFLYTFSKFSNISLWKFPIDIYSQKFTLSADGKYIVLAESFLTDYPRSLHLFNRESPIPIWSWVIGGYITSVAISDDGSVIAAGGHDASVFTAGGPGGTMYLFSSKSLIPIFTHNTPWLIESLSISSDAKSIAAASTIRFVCAAIVGYPCPKDEGELYAFNFGSSYSSWSYDMGNSITSCSISSDGRSILVGCNETLYNFQNKI